MTDQKVSYLNIREVIELTHYFLESRQSHTTIATVEKITDGSYILKALKQKLFVDGLCYLLQEIYGIENKNNDTVIHYFGQFF